MLSNISCAKKYQWEWWGLWFEICLLISLFVTAFFEAFHKGRLVFITYFTLATMTLSQGAHNFITSSFVGQSNFNISDRTQARPLPVPSAHPLVAVTAASQSRHLSCAPTRAIPPRNMLRTRPAALIIGAPFLQAAYNAGAAGYVLLCLFNFCLLIILGTGTLFAQPSPSACTLAVLSGGADALRPGLRCLRHCSHGRLAAVMTVFTMSLPGYEDIPTSAPKPLEPEVTNNV